MTALTKFAFNMSCFCVIAFCLSRVGWAESLAENFRDPPKYRSWYFRKVPFYRDVEVPEWFYRVGSVVNLASLRAASNSVGRGSRCQSPENGATLRSWSMSVIAWSQ
jgi:hypothetical protein